MNKFDTSFFQKYIPEWQELINVIHTHALKIIGSIFVQISLFAVLPSFFYYYSKLIQEFVPFYWLEILLILVFIKIIYNIFDWYNDVWLITNDWIISLERSLLSTSVSSLNYENIEWIWVEENWFMDKLFTKWDLVIQKIWDDAFILENAVNPFSAVDIIERVGEYVEHEHEEVEEDKFDVIMDALGWVVWNYLDKKDIEKSEKQEKIEELIEKIEQIKEEEWTIDLR